MPTWLVHGFRWPRRAIRVHIILQNLEECAPGWIMAPDTAAELAENFHTLYPERMTHIPNLRFIEQYDPDDETASDQPYAYVCDQVHEIRLGVDVDEIRGMGVPGDTWNALVELRNDLAPGEKLGWFVVVNGDLERGWDDDYDEEDEGDDVTVNGNEQGYLSPNFASPTTPTTPTGSTTPGSKRSSTGKVDDDDGDQKKKGFKAWFGNLKKSRSIRDLRTDLAVRSSPMSPPLPDGSPTVASPKRNGKAAV